MADRNSDRTDMYRSSSGSVPSVQESVSSGQTNKRRLLPKPLFKQHTTIGITSPVDDTVAGLQMKLECAVCFDVYRESGSSAPRSLSCGHSFCTRCISELVKGNGLNCPKCHHHTPLLSQSVNELPKNFAILEIMYSNPHSEQKEEKEEKESSTPPHNNDTSSSPTIVSLCTQHGDQLSSYCEEDQTLVCSSCLLYGPHKQHKSKLVNEAATDCRQTLVKLTPGISEMMITANQATSDIDTAMERVNVSSQRISDDIEEHFKELIHVLERRKNELKLDALHRSQNRIEALLEQKKSIMDRIETGQTIHDTCTKLLASNDSYNLLIQFPQVTKDITQLFKQFPSLDPIGRDDLIFEFPKDSLDELECQYINHGSLRAGVGTVSRIMCESFHDGIRIHWKGHNYVDSIGISYAVQVTRDHQDFVTIYRGGETKYTWRFDAVNEVSTTEYSFRVRVQTCEGVGEWSDVVSCRRVPPQWKWDKKWCNIKIEIDETQLGVWSRHSSNKNWTSVAGNTVLSRGQHYMEIEIREIAKHHIRRDWFTKLALGVIQCTQSSANSIPWQEYKYPIGQLPNYDSYAFLATPTCGIKMSNTIQYGSKEEDYGGIVSLQVEDRLGMLVDFSFDGSATLSYFFNGQDLGLAFSSITGPLLPVLSVCDKFNVELKFPPPPYSKRNPRLTLLSSGSSTALF